MKKKNIINLKKNPLESVYAWQDIKSIEDIHLLVVSLWPLSQLRSNNYIELAYIKEASRRFLPTSLASLIWFRIAFNIGTIIAVVAVLLIHMDRNQHGNIMPNINLQAKQHMIAHSFIIYTWQPV